MDQQGWMAFWTFLVFLIMLPFYFYATGRLSFWYVKQVYDFFAVVFGWDKGDTGKQRQAPAVPRRPENLSVVIPGKPPEVAERDQVGGDRPGPGPSPGRQEPELPF